MEGSTAFKILKDRDSICSVPPFSSYVIKVLVNDQSDCSKVDSYVLIKHFLQHDVIFNLPLQTAIG